MKTSYDVIKTLLRTEKGTFLEPLRQYVFQVYNGSSKAEIKKAIEEVYSVKVQAVNTALFPGKRKRVRQEFGYTSPWKKAVVTLKDGFKIDVT